MKIVYNGMPQARAFKDVLGAVIPDILERRADAIYLDADLMSCIGTLAYARRTPPGRSTAGIAEANMIGIACGLGRKRF